MSSHYTSEEVINKCKLAHPNENYDFSKFELTRMNDKSIFICNQHGKFLQSPTDHILGRGCPKCAKIKISRICNENNKRNTIPFQTIIERFNIVHNNFYQYIKPEIFKGYRQKIKIICPIHGVFIQQVQSHLNGAGCPNCSTSKGENKIKNFLINHSISFKPQYKLNDCKNIFPLSFDFYLPDYNTLIEFDGKQHFEPVQYGGISLEKANKKFKQLQTNDKIKNEYCLENSIRLIRIPHWNFKDIKSILEKELS